MHTAVGVLRLLLGCGALLLAGCGTAPDVAVLRGETMGTHFSVQISPSPAPALRDDIRRQVERRLGAINAQMSTYLPDSELERFNRSGETAWQPVPPGLAALVERAQGVSRLTGGRYDITVGPLVDLWGFGSESDRSRPPDKDEIARRLQQVGFRKLEVRRSPPALRKTVADLTIDLSSIAKGWAVDALTALLLDRGVTGFLVEIGGETRVHGHKSDGSPWRIAIEQPDTADRRPLVVLAVDDLAVATSGDYRNYFEHDGQRYSHTIDPRTGHPVRHRLASVTVLSDNCTDADAWATALLALGEEAGPALADMLSLQAMFVIREDQRLHTLTSAAWSAPAPPG